MLPEDVTAEWLRAEVAKEGVAASVARRVHYILNTPGGIDILQQELACRRADDDHSDLTRWLLASIADTHRRLKIVEAATQSA